eukprot:7744054-Pyramimonas_sp.AAC.1
MFRPTGGGGREPGEHRRAQSERRDPAVCGSEVWARGGGEGAAGGGCGHSPANDGVWRDPTLHGRRVRQGGGEFEYPQLDRVDRKKQRPASLGRHVRTRTQMIR